MTIKESYQDFAEAKRKFYSALTAYKNALPIKGGELVTIKETGEKVVLCEPHVVEETGAWWINRCHKLKKDGTPHAYTTPIISAEDEDRIVRHVTVNGVEYPCNEVFKPIEV